MVEHISMNRHIMTFNQLWCIATICLFTLNTAYAEALKDPTQPPAAFYNQAHSTDGSGLLDGPVLQSIILGANHHAAIINGQKVMLGKKYDGATLIRLNEREAVLRNPDNTLKVLTMDYAIQKKILPANGQTSFAKKGSQPK